MNKGYRPRQSQVLAGLLGYALIFVLLASCSEAETAATQVLVVIHSDLELGAQLSRIEAIVQSTDGTRTASAPFPFALAPREEHREGTYSLPLSFGIAKPAGGADSFRVAITGYGPLGPDGSEVEVIEQKAIASFQSQRTLRLTVFLGSVCLRKSCEGDDVACFAEPATGIRAGDCGPVQEPALEPVRPRAELDDVPGVSEGPEAGQGVDAGPADPPERDGGPGPADSGADDPGPGAERRTRIAAGAFHSCAIVGKGALKCWGSNIQGQLGDGSDEDYPGAPVSVVGLHDVVEISAGAGHTCALRAGGVLNCWGNDFAGRRNTPGAVVGLVGTVTTVAAGGTAQFDNNPHPHTCALLDSGEVKCWGRNDYGQLGDGTTANRTQPVDVAGLTGDVVALAAGGRHSCALLAAGSVQCWGRNDYGQLGNDSMTDQSTPVEVRGLASGVVALAAGGFHTCALLDSGGVQCWGRGPGNGQPAEVASAVDVVELSGDVVAVTAGLSHTCALLTTGAMKCWGSDSSGQRGDGTSDAGPATPADVVGLSSGVVAIAAGQNHTCALRDTGEVRCWGDGAWGQLGNGGGDFVMYSEPDPIRVLAAP